LFGLALIFGTSSVQMPLTTLGLGKFLSPMPNIARVLKDGGLNKLLFQPHDAILPGSFFLVNFPPFMVM
jgi:hypothetical protein